MAEQKEGGGGGFGWGLVIGGLAGLVAGAYFASGPGREQVDTLRDRTIELSGRGEELRARARSVVNPEHPIGRAINEGMAAARRRRQELETPEGSTGPETGTSAEAPPAGSSTGATDA